MGEGPLDSKCLSLNRLVIPSEKCAFEIIVKGNVERCGKAV